MQSYITLFWPIYITSYTIIETRKLSGLLPTAIEYLRKTLTPVTSQLGQQSD